MRRLPAVSLFWIHAWLLVLGFFGPTVVQLRAQSDQAASGEVVTDPGLIIQLSSEEKRKSLPIKWEGRVSYADPFWRHLWLEKNGVGAYVMLSAKAPGLRTGQRVSIEGSFTPSHGLEASAVTVRVLKEFEPILPLNAEHRIGDLTTLQSRIVTTQAYVEDQMLNDDQHLRLSLIVEDQPVIGWVRPENPQSIPNLRGSFIRITGLYQARFDPTRTQLTIEIWTAQQRDIIPLGSIADSHRFDIPRTPINELYNVPRGYEVRLRGRIRSHEPGTYMTIRDETGQVMVQSVQQQRLREGTEVEAVGRVAFVNARWQLQSALVREVGRKGQSSRGTTPAGAPLVFIEQIRQLGSDAAAKGRPVKISGTVTWSRSGYDFFFLEDLTGGIRIRFKPEQMDAPPRNKYLEVTGSTYDAGFSPAVEMQDFRELGAMSAPPVKEISFERAMTGEEDGQLVDMRGFYQSTESDGEVRKIHVATPAGDFVGILLSPVNFLATSGSRIRVRGACEAVTDESGHITGIALRIPSLQSITIEESAPVDFYDLPLQSIKELRRLVTSREMTRVRVSGVVLHALPGHFVFLQDEDNGLLVLSRDETPLAPGDKVETVGILGTEGVRIVLREAVFRKLASGPAPAPTTISDLSHLYAMLDSRLVKMRATLIDAVESPERTRLTLQSGSTVFEAVLDHSQGNRQSLDLAFGAGLELTGVYKLTFDDSRQTRSFQLLLRDPGDVVVYQAARVWTLQRALIIIAILAGCTLLGIAWVAALRARVNRQTEQIREQMQRQAELEAEVQRAARLESLGILAGGIAHDFNNLLTIVLGNVTLVMLDDAVMEIAGKSIRDIEKGAIRARDLTQQLLTFAKGGNPLRSTVSLGSIVRDTAEFVLHGSNVRCDHDIPDDLWNANVDKDQIGQVIQNLVLNAMQAMPRGGVVRFVLRNEIVSTQKQASLNPGRYIRLSVTDAGEGIKPEVLPRIFDPYFSTKRGGSGLGLATVYSIVKRHQGHIDVESVLGKGTTFVLWLPAAEASSQAPAAPAPSAPVAPLQLGRVARVLLMDDEESIRALGAQLLKKIGVEPHVVSDGAAAVHEFRSAQQAQKPFDLVILDLTIPGGMGGREAMSQIREMDTNVPAIVCSGYSNDPVLANFKNYGFQAMVPKPYDVSRMAETVKRLLEQSRN